MCLWPRLRLGSQLCSTPEGSLGKGLNIFAPLPPHLPDGDSVPHLRGPFAKGLAQLFCGEEVQGLPPLLFSPPTFSQPPWQGAPLLSVLPILKDLCVPSWAVLCHSRLHVLSQVDETTMRYNFTSAKTAIIKNRKRSVGKDVKKLKPLHTVGKIKWCSLYGKQCEDS